MGDALDVLFPSRGFDATFLSDVTSEAVLRDRLSMKIFLSRHGRIDFDSWEGKDLREMRETFDELVSMIKVEFAKPEGGA